MLPFHFPPGLLVLFMVALAVVPLAIIWWDERRVGAGSDRLDRLRAEVRLREQLAQQARAETGRRDLVAPRG